jgi:hypothetical protein
MTLPTFYGFQPGTDEARAPRAWPRFMTARVAADYADSSPWTIRRHVQPCGRRGRTFIYAIEAIEQWMRGTGVAQAEERGPVPQRRAPRKTARNTGRDLASATPSTPRVAAHDEHVAA